MSVQEGPRPGIDAWPSLLVVVALPMELQGRYAARGVPVLYTGVGKVNATLALTEALMAYRASGRDLPRVVNLGTAGGRSVATHTLVGCHRFVQRDMDVTGLGFALGETPYDTLPPLIEHPRRFAALPEALCGSADAFDTGTAGLAAEVVDMEGYALAKVCRQFSAAFACAKYVTDGADGAAASDWRANLRLAADAFDALYGSLPTLDWSQ